MTHLELGAGIPDFKIRLRGYDRTEVEEYLHQIRMGEAIAQAYDLAARSDHDPADANRLVEQASQDADEIRTRAAEQARRTLDEAEREAEATRVHAETCAQLVRQEGESRAEVQAAELREINRQARGMLSDVQRDVARCLLEIGAAAERDARTLLATADAADGQVPAGTPADVETGTVKRQAPADAVRSIVDAGPYTAGERGWSLTWTSGLAAGGLAGGALLMFLAVSFGAPNQPDMWVEVGQSAPVASALSKTGNVRSVTELSQRAQASSGERGPSLAQVSYASRLSAPPTSGLMITLKAERVCWISAVVDGGERLERLMEADDTIVLHARDEALVKVGNAAALSVLINNRETKPLGTDGQVVDLRINQATYRAYLRDRL